MRSDCFFRLSDCQDGKLTELNAPTRRRRVSLAVSCYSIFGMSAAAVGTPAHFLRLSVIDVQFLTLPVRPASDTVRNAAD